MPSTPSIRSLTVENERLLRECNELREENARLEKLLQEERTKSKSCVTIHNGAAHNTSNLAVTNQAECSASITKYSASEDKINLFQTLFHGRPDVYARQWKGKGDQSGYSPACQNEWIRGICGKPKMRCANCRRAEYFPFDTTAIQQHLLGQQVIGIYPLLKDDTCAFIAIDFSEASWRLEVDMAAYVCNNHRIPYAIEISRSGNGAHFWLFFHELLSAAIARNFGAALLTQVMQHCATLSFSAYDRLYPNQDSVPRGGFGNPIALPLQKEARAKGNSLFVNSNFIPYEDQWAFLASLSKVSSQQVSALMAVSRTPPLGALYAQLGEDEKPWNHFTRVLTHSDLPPVIECTLENMLCIPTVGLSDRAQNHLMRLAAFPNPLYDQAQAMRMPVWDKPRVICSAENKGNHLSLPRGCLEALVEFGTINGFRVTLRDKRTTGRNIDVHFTGALRDEQKTAFAALCTNNEGVLSATTAFGKTVIGAALIGYRRVNTLILVHRKQLVVQWQERLTQFLDIHEPLPGPQQKNSQKATIGIYGSGKDLRNGIVDVATLQSIGSADEIKPFLQEYGMVIVDECHHVPAASFENVVKHVRAKYIYGLTATPTRRDGHDPILYMYVGPIRYHVDAKSQIMKRPFSHVVLPRFTGSQFHFDQYQTSPALTQYFSQMILDERRNRMIVDDVLACVSKGRNCLLLSERTQHVRTLAASLDVQGIPVFTLMGGKSAAETKRQLDALQHAPLEKPLVVCATGKYIGEGFDEPRLDTLFLTMPVSWQGTLSQYVGRLHRLHDGKQEVRVYDYIDHNAEILERMYHKRLNGYAAIGYQVCGNQETTCVDNNMIYDQTSFQERFLQDIRNALRSVEIVSPYISIPKVRWLEEVITNLLNKGVKVTIMTRPPASFTGQNATAAKDAFNALHRLKVLIQTREKIHQKHAVIDESIVWYGSINLLSFGASQESIMRFVSSSAANVLRL